MESWTRQAVERDLNNPFSPYYINKPTVYEQIRGFLNGRGGVNTAGYYNTNYFGPGRVTYLAQPKCDIVDINNKIKKRSDFDNLLGKILFGTAAVVSLLLLRKIPGTEKLVKGVLSGTFTGIGKVLSGVFKGLSWLVKK